MGKNRIYPLSGRGHEISYEKTSTGYYVEWASLQFNLKTELYKLIINNFFKDENNWYTLGASATEPIKGGFGEYLANVSAFTPRHASAIASIMVNERDIEYKGNKPIMLRKL